MWTQRRTVDKRREIGYLEDCRFCIVQMTVLDEEKQKVRLQSIHGIAKVYPDRLVVVDQTGTQHIVPDSAIPDILQNDGTPVLGNCHHYCVVKIAAKGDVTLT
jgi:hypothetical protein